MKNLMRYFIYCFWQQIIQPASSKEIFQQQSYSEGVWTNSEVAEIAALQQEKYETLQAEDLLDVFELIAAHGTSKGYATVMWALFTQANPSYVTLFEKLWSDKEKRAQAAVAITKIVTEAFKELGEDGDHGDKELLNIARDEMVTLIQQFTTSNDSVRNIFNQLHDICNNAQEMWFYATRGSIS